MFNRCSHKFGKIQADGYQYCYLCNKAISVPCNHIHRWAEHEEYTKRIITNIIQPECGICIILKCEICGDLKTFNSGINS